MRQIFRVALYFAVLFASISTPVQASRRVALVIGNGNYENAGALVNPANDAADISRVLSGLGFDVFVGTDLDKAAMELKIRDFAVALDGASTGLFFYAGHGLQVNGTNYLVPVDAKLTTASALDFEMVRLDLVQRAMERATKTNIILLDACRNNPLARNLARAMGTRSFEIGRGLAPAESGKGTLISYSTQPGNVALDGSGRNSPYASALVKYLPIKGEDLQSTLVDVRRSVVEETDDRQVPWDHSALMSKVYLGGEPSQAPRAPDASSNAILPDYGPAADEEPIAYRVTSFTWQTSPQEVDPGKRIWRRETDVGWSEKWPSGFVKRTSSKARVIVDGCSGTVVGPDDEPDFALFIPDRNCRQMFLRFRRGYSGPWHMLAAMKDVR